MAMPMMKMIMRAAGGESHRKMACQSSSSSLLLSSSSAPIRLTLARHSQQQMRPMATSQQQPSSTLNTIKSSIKGRERTLLATGAVLATGGFIWMQARRSKKKSASSTASTSATNEGTLDHDDDDDTPPKVGEPNMPLKAIDETLRLWESTWLTNNKSVARIDLNYIESNNPIEDENFAITIPKRKGVLCNVLDGHWDPHTVKALKKYLPTYISTSLSSLPRSSDPETIKQALKQSYEKMDSDLLNLPIRIIPNFYQLSPTEIKSLPYDVRIKAREAALLALEGACSVTAYIENNNLYYAHAGDARAVLGVKGPNGSWQAVRLTEDHTPRNPKEMQRLVSEHPGEEKTVAWSRSGEKGYLRVLGGMAPSRAFGDAKFKAPLEWTVRIDALLQSLPKIRRTFRTPSNYKTPPYLEVVKTVASHLEGKQVTVDAGGLTGKKARTLKANLESRDANAATHLIRTALANGNGVEGVSRMLTLDRKESRHYRDDMTAMVVLLPAAEKLLNKSKNKHRLNPKAVAVLEPANEKLTDVSV
ncbi:hypothetical protein HDU76_007512 [Blyttiomyces sp. JEL0837]|nr:hypothetical protein HDU76_007512 [Blyttiomyces sp. JEL0837]